MPAAAVIPAPIAYIKVVAVKKLVVEVLLVYRFGPRQSATQASVCNPISALTGLSRRADTLP